MSKPTYASSIPFVPADWSDRDAITGRILEILEAVIPEGRQLEATKRLVKEATKGYWIEMFNNQYEVLTGNTTIYLGNDPTYRVEASLAIWKVIEAKSEKSKEKRLDD